MRAASLGGHPWCTVIVASNEGGRGPVLASSTCWRHLQTRRGLNALAVADAPSCVTASCLSGQPGSNGGARLRGRLDLGLAQAA